MTLVYTVFNKDPSSIVAFDRDIYIDTFHVTPCSGLGSDDCQLGLHHVYGEEVNISDINCSSRSDRVLRRSALSST